MKNEHTLLSAVTVHVVDNSLEWICTKIEEHMYHWNVGGPDGEVESRNVGAVVPAEHLELINSIMDVNVLLVVFDVLKHHWSAKSWAAGKGG